MSPRRAARRADGRAPRRRRVTALVAAAAALAVAGGGLLAHERFGRPLLHMAHWRVEEAREAPPDAARLVVLGDSSAVGVGASRPSQSLAGRAVTHLERSTGGPVHASNRAVGGARTADVRGQFERADLAGADVVLVSVGSVDATAGAGLGRFERDMAALLDALPAERTVFSDIAAVPGHRPYQDVFAALADERGILRADFEGAFHAAGRRDVFAPDGLHLDSLGYGIWFDAVRPRLDTVLAR